MWVPEAAKFFGYGHFSTSALMSAAPTYSQGTRGLVPVGFVGGEPFAKLVKRATNSLIHPVRAASDLGVQVRGGGRLTELAGHDVKPRRCRHGMASRVISGRAITALRSGLRNELTNDSVADQAVDLGD